MGEEVRHAAPPDDELREYWERLSGEDSHLRGVEVAAWEDPDGSGWQVTIWAREFSGTIRWALSYSSGLKARSAPSRE